MIPHHQPYNLLVFCANGLRADFLSCYGGAPVETMHIDELARGSVCFSNAYAASPLRGPSLTSLLSSTYVGEHGYRAGNARLDFRLPNLIRALKEDEFITASFGGPRLFKDSDAVRAWDLIHAGGEREEDAEPSSSPIAGALAGTTFESDRYKDLPNQVRQAFSMAREKQRPLLAWIALDLPENLLSGPFLYEAGSLAEQTHVHPAVGTGASDQRNKPRRCRVWRAHSGANDMTEAEIRGAIANYCAHVRMLDQDVGAVLNVLRDAGLVDNTLVLFFSGHGQLCGDYGLFNVIPVFYDCLTRIPVIMRHPEGLWRPGMYDGLVEAVDLAPTLLEALGVPTPPSMVGRSLHMDLVAGRDVGRSEILVEGGTGYPTLKEPLPLRQESPTRMDEGGPGAMVRWGRWKLSVYADDQNELYDVVEDPHELRNRYDDRACNEVCHLMLEKLASRLLAVKVRDTSIEWPGGGQDPRRMPLPG